MVLRPETDPITGLLRLVGDDNPVDITFFENQLGVFPLGVFLGSGNDTVRSLVDPALIYGNQGNDQIFGGGGNDTLYGGQGDDYIEGNEGDDLIFGNAGNDILSGGPGNDTIFGGPGNDVIDGDAGNNLIYGGQGSDILRGGEGNDLIFGDAGENTIFGGPGNDTLYGGTDDDQIGGGLGNDLILGGSGDDIISGGEGDDTIYGGLGNDLILADEGNNILFGNSGSNTLVGGTGNDTFVLEAGNGLTTIADTDQIFDFTPGQDTILLLGDAPIDQLNIILDDTNPNINNTILETPTGEIIALLRGIRPNDINRSDFFVPGVLSFESTRFEVQDNGMSTQPITVVRSGGEDGAVSVTLIPSLLTPLPPRGVDISPIMINFPDGELGGKTVSIPIANNPIVTYPEVLELSLQDATGNATLINPTVATLSIISDQTPPDPIQTFNNPIPESFARFGAALETVNNQILIGSPGWNNSQGLVYVLDGTTGEILPAFENPSANAGSSEFGAAIASLGLAPVIGAPTDSSIAFASGAVYVYNTITGLPVTQLFNPTPEPFDYFGYSLATIGNDIIIGAPGDSTSELRGGIAYLFDGITGELRQIFNNPNPQPDDYFGAAIASVGDWVLIGAPGSLGIGQSNRPGSAYLFNSVTGDLIQSFRNPNPGLDNFGHAVAWTGIGRDIIIGSPGDDQRGINAGAAFLIDGITGSVLANYTPENLRTGDRFGEFITTTSNNNVVVGSPGFGPFDFGAAFKFQLRTGELLETYLHPELPPSDGVLNFGSAIASFNAGLIIAAPDTNIGLEGVGAVYQF